MIRKYLSLFMLLSILFPIGEKVMHDIEHFNEDRCELNEIHYCKKEHACSICEYVFAFPHQLTKEHDQIKLFAGRSNIQTPLKLDSPVTMAFLLPSLRGPPPNKKQTT